MHNEAPQIGEFLERVDRDSREHLLVRLVQLEVNLRRNQGETVDLDSYVSRFAESEELIRAVYLDESKTAVPSPTVAFDMIDSDIAFESWQVKQLGDYQLLGRIGQGGMGVVYKGKDVKLDKTVAIKVLPVNAMISKSARTRFQNEARAAGQLDHPHVVPVYAFGIEKGTYYYAMQYINGKNLAGWIAEFRQDASHGNQGKSSQHKISTAKAQEASTSQGLSSFDLQNALKSGGSTSNREFVEAFARMGVQVADALQHAHDTGIVHRDIKPSNLLVDQNGDVFVADFGLAQVQGESALTKPGDVIGTWRYMSPEQAYAKRIVVDHRTDIFSLGATLYELLTLRHAFNGRTRTEILRQIAFEDPVAPRKINRRLPEALELIVLKCLAKNPDERYQTAGDLAGDLRAWTRDEPIKARRPTVPQKMVKWARRHRALVNSVTAIFAVIIVSAMSMLAFAVQTETKARRHVESKNSQLTAALKKSEGRRLSALGSLELSRNPGLAAALAKEGAKLHRDADAMTVLVAALDANHEQFVRKQTAPVGDVQFSPDGKTILVTGDVSYFSSDPVPARLYDASTGVELLKLQGAKTITSAAFHPEGRRVLTASTRSTPLGYSAEVLAESPPQIWDIDRGVRIGQLDGAFLVEAKPESFCPVGEATLIVAPALENTAKVFNAAGDATLTLRGHTDWVFYAGYSPDGTKIVTLSNDKTVRVWDAQSGEQLRKLDHWAARSDTRLPVNQVVFTHDSKQLLTCSPSLGVDLWDLASEDSRPCGSAIEVAVSPDGEQFALGFARSIQLVDSAQLSIIGEIKLEHPVKGIVFSPDSRYLATWDTSTRFQIWDSEATTLVAELRGHDGPALSVAFSPDSNRLVSGSNDGTTRVWYAQSGAERAHFPETLPTNLPIVSRSGDNAQHLMTTRHQQHSVVLNVESGQPLLTRAARLSGRESTEILVSTDEEEVQVLEGASGKVLAKFKQRIGSRLSAELSPDGRTVFIRSLEGTSWIWKWQTDVRFPIGTPNVDLNDNVFHPHQPVVATVDRKGLIRTLEVETGRLLKNASVDGCTALHYSPDGSRLLAVSSQNRAVIFNSQDLMPLLELGSIDYPMNTGKFADGGDKVLTYAHSSKELCCWDAANGNLLHRVTGPAGTRSISLHPEEKLAVVTSTQGGLFHWDLVEGRIDQISETPYRAAEFLDQQRIVAATALPTGAPLSSKMTTSPASKLEIWDIQKADQPTRTIELPHLALRSLKKSSIENAVIGQGFNHSLAVYDSRIRKKRGVIGGHAAPISFARFTPGNNEIVTCSYDHSVAIWDAQSLQLKRFLKGHTAPVLAAVISSDGKRLASGDTTGRVLLWNLAEDTSDPIGELTGLSDPIDGLSFSAFAVRLASFTNKGAWQVWDTESANPLPYDHSDQPMRWVQFQPEGSRLLLANKPDRRKEEKAWAIVVSADGESTEIPIERSVRQIRFDPTGQRILALLSRKVFLYQPATGKLDLKISLPRESISSAEFDERGERLLTFQGTSLAWWDSNGQRLLSFAGDDLLRMIPSVDHAGKEKLFVVSADKRLRSILLDTKAILNTARELSKMERERYQVDFARQQIEQVVEGQ
ncbi:protein kinase domain-containing protein [Stieleria neptunia]|nr:protein kinase [Stieleria neptunia]